MKDNFRENVCVGLASLTLTLNPFSTVGRDLEICCLYLMQWPLARRSLLEEYGWFKEGDHEKRLAMKARIRNNLTELLWIKIKHV